MSNSSLEEQIKAVAEKSILEILSSGYWIEPDYRNRVKIPGEFMSEVWDLIDTDRIKKQLADRIEKELANRIVNHMAKELATDIKTILAVKERREALRSVAVAHLDKICSPKLTHDSR